MPTDPPVPDTTDVTPPAPPNAESSAPLPRDPSRENDDPPSPISVTTYSYDADGRFIYSGPQPPTAPPDESPDEPHIVG